MMGAEEIGQLLTVADELRLSTWVLMLLMALMIVLFYTIVSNARTNGKQLDVLKSMQNGTNDLRQDIRAMTESVKDSMVAFTTELMKPLNEFNVQVAAQALRIDGALKSIDETLDTLNARRDEDKLEIAARQRAIQTRLSKVEKKFDGVKLNLSGEMATIRTEFNAILTDSKRAREMLNEQAEDDLVTARKQGRELSEILSKAKQEIDGFMRETKGDVQKNAGNDRAGVGGAGDAGGGADVGGAGAVGGAVRDGSAE
jgi:hypothetical protein